MEQPASKLSPLQLELLRIYSFNPSEKELLEIKDMLAAFFAHRYIGKVQSAAEKKGISNDTLDQWLEEDDQ